MIRFALRGLLARKLRTALTALAIVLGVAMVSGTYVLTDSIDRAFGGIFTEIYRGTDATVTGRAAFDITEGMGTAPAFDESLLQEVRALPSVAAAVGGVASESAQLVKDGEVIVFGGAPNLGFSVDPSVPELSSLDLVRGAWPGPDEVVVDVSTADRKDLAVGDTIGVQANGPVRELRISGLFEFGGAQSIGGATLAGFDLRTGQQLFGKEGELDQIRASAKPGVAPEELVEEIEAILPPGTQVRTGDAQAREDAEGTTEFITFLQSFLLAFGGIALFVGSFVIANSLSITIAQRTRELATLRTIGASRRQVLGSIVFESLVVGGLASLTGLFLGLGLATGLFELFDAVGFTLPNDGLVFLPRTAVVSLLVGTVVTLVASLRPALRATRVPPIAAVREGATLPPSRFARLRTPGSLALTTTGFAALVYGLFGPGLETTGILAAMGVGALLVFFGVALLAARLVRPLAAALGWPATQAAGVSGALARDNARRNPDRTASTAAALMIGLALVTLVAVLAAGITQTFRGAVDDLWAADYAITAENNFSPIPTAIGRAAGETPGVTAVASVRGGEARAFGSTIFTSAITPGASEVFRMDWVDGSPEVLAELGDDGALVDDDYAESHDLAVGSTLTLLTPRGRQVELVVRGIFDPPTGGSPFGRVTISAARWDREYDQPRDLYTFLRIGGGESEANERALERALDSFPNAKLQTKEEFIDNQIAALNAILNVLYVLLALSVLVSLFGIVNTLVLSVFERTRELGMLRAIGMTRRQVRRMIRYESVITAALGGSLGIPLGIALGALLVGRVDFIDFSLPVGSIVVFAIAAIAVGMLAAIFPARRASRLDPLRALQYE